MVRKVFIRIVIPLLLIISMMGNITLAISNGIVINQDTFSFVNKEKMLSSNFDSSYDINSDSNVDKDFIEQIKELTKKTTYLLLGDGSNAKESSENYYKRHEDYLKLRYDPEIPKDENSLIGLDENSEEYHDDLLAGISVNSMFLQLNELEIKYSSIGNIRISIVDEKEVISTITLPNIEMKQPDPNDPKNYIKMKTDLTMYYFFKKLNGEYKLLYLYGETIEDIAEYLESDNEKSGTLSKSDDYNSSLKDMYDFSKADAIKDKTLNKIYNNNKDKIVFLNATYNMGTVASANGFFINKGLIMTTYNFIEKSLMKAQVITIRDALGNVYELDGVVTINASNDIAILKVKTNKNKYIKYDKVKNIKVEDGIVTINSKTGVGLTSSKGIITGLSQHLQTSLPITEELQGSPVFDKNGKLVGMLNSQMLNTSISFATKPYILEKYYDKFSKIDYSNVKSVSFDTLKENYYIKYNNETAVNNASQNDLKKYSNVENAIDLIELELIKSSYKDGIISLRFKNDISNYIDTMQFAAGYKNNLKNKGYKENIVSDSKCIYENGKYQIIIMKEFNYLIIVMVRV